MRVGYEFGELSDQKKVFKGILSQLVGRYGRLARFYLKINAFVLTTQVLYTTSYLFHMSH